MQKLLLSIFFIFFIQGIYAQNSSLVYPKNKQVLSDTNIAFFWDETIGADKYQLQLALDSDFQFILIDSTNIVSPFIDINFQPSNQFFWRVIPIVGNIPIVSTDVGDVREVIGNTQGCYLTSFEPSDVADKIEKALLFGKRTTGRKDIRHLESGIIAKKIISIYKKI